MNEQLQAILDADGPNRLDRAFPGTLSDMFDNDRPLEVEIGSGKGRFLLGRASIMPERNFVGFDYIWKFLKIGWQRASKRDYPNLLFFKAEANEVVTHLLPEESVTIFHIYFPDPWHKKRHNKRRLLTAEFFKLVHSRLIDGGLLEIATDNFEYFIYLKGALIEAGDDLWTRQRESRNERIMNPEFATNFEMKYTEEGRDLFYLELRK
jgi:tRNA (guanine-N7-)-methyltransferase